jgi:hypothetical protein
MSRTMEPIDKKQLLAQIESSRVRLESVLARVPQARMTEAGVEGSWSVKDLIDHIVVWEQRMLEWLATSLAGEQPRLLPEGFVWDDLDRWNQETYEARRERTLDQVLEDFNATYPQVLQSVRDAPEDDLFQPDRFPWRENSPLWKLVGGNTFWHYDEHAQSIERWLEGVASEPGE